MNYYRTALSAAYILLWPMVAIASAQGAEPSEAVVAKSFIEPRPIRPEMWLMVDDYPLSDFRAGIQGVVGVQLSIDLTGQPYRCQVYASSGSASLDAASCTTKMERARFVPARDDQGHPVYSQVSLPTTWINPNAWAKPPASRQRSNTIIQAQELDSMTEVDLSLILGVGKTGRITSCREKRSTRKDLADRACQFISKGGVTPLLDENGKSVESAMVWLVTFTGAVPSPSQKGTTFQSQ